MSRWAGLTAVTFGFVALMFAGCGEPAHTDGIVTGRASPCVGPPTPGEDLREIRYTISLERGSRTVSEQTLTGDAAARYRFDVPAGRYRIKNPPASVDVTVRTGQTTHANLFVPCG
jgi:hypothetical protein